MCEIRINLFYYYYIFVNDLYRKPFLDGALVAGSENDGVEATAAAVAEVDPVSFHHVNGREHLHPKSINNVTQEQLF